MTDSTLVGRWVHIIDDEYGGDWRVAMAVGPAHYLLKQRPYNNCCPPSSQLVAIDDLCCDLYHGRHVAIFDDEKEMDLWLAFTDAPKDEDGPRVVAMRRDN